MGYRPASRMDALLYELCTKHGWCLRENERNALIAAKPRNHEAVTDAIIRAELGESHLHDRDTRDWLARIVSDWLFDPAGRGARSGLPGPPCESTRFCLGLADIATRGASQPW